MENKLRYTLLIIIMLIMVVFLTGCGEEESQTAQIDKFDIVSSFYPIQIMLLNITEGIDTVEIKALSNQEIGCIGEYTLTQADLIGLEKADVFIQNGLGIENFTDTVTSTYPELRIINSIELGEGEQIEDEHEGHDHNSNLHVWTSIETYKQQVMTIAEELGKLDVANKDAYLNNAKSYIIKIEAIEQKYNTDTLIFKKAVTFHETLVHLAEEQGFVIEVVETGHEDSSLSADELSAIIDKMNNENINVILADPNESMKNVNLVANETLSDVYYLDSYIQGDIDKDAYLKALDENLLEIKRIKEGIGI